MKCYYKKDCYLISFIEEIVVQMKEANYFIKINIGQIFY